MYEIKESVIHSKEGIPCAPRWFSDSRLAFEFDDTGVSRVEYRNPQPPVDNNTVFVRTLFDGFRYYVEENGLTYKPEFFNSEIYPFGIYSEWDFNGSLLKHSAMAIDESIVFRLKTQKNISDKLQFKLEFYESFGLSGKFPNDFRYISQNERVWKPWIYIKDENLLRGGFYEPEAERPSPDPLSNNPGVRIDGLNAAVNLDIYINASFEYTLKKIEQKHILKSGYLEPNSEYTFIISFSECRKTVDEESVIVRYKNISKKSPVLKSPYKKLNDFISLAPFYHESLKLTDFSGAVRAKTTNYGVWGWDSLTSNYASFYWGDSSFIKDMLLMFQKTCDKGIAHCFSNDMQVTGLSALPAQGMYITLLLNYYTDTKDIEFVKSCYPLAKEIFLKASEAEVGELGFCRGQSLFPDFPKLMKETDNDLSLFNNTVLYSAARGMDYIASLIGDNDIAVRAREIARRMEANFTRLFYNSEKGFVVNSVNGENLSQNDCYNALAIKLENQYCMELLNGLTSCCMDFFCEHIVCKAGLRAIPVWDTSFDADANQLHSWWPVMGDYYMRLINHHNRKDLIDKWAELVGYFTENLMCPEGISYYIENAMPEFDRWTTQAGTWQAYSLRGWYQEIIHSICGIEVEAGGMTFYPYEGEDIELLGLHFGKSRFDIKIRGSGCFIEKIILNGQEIRGTNKLPLDKLSLHNKIEVCRALKNPNKISILHGYGIEISEYEYNFNEIKGKISGYGMCRLKIASESTPNIYINGKKIQFDSQNKWAEFILEGNKEALIITL